MMIEITKRQREIINILATSDFYWTLDSLSKHFNVSKRTIQNDLYHIDSLCSNNDIKIIKKPSFGIKIEYNVEFLNNLNFKNSFLDKNERLDYIIIFLLNNEITTYKKIADKLKVSRQTVINDFPKVCKRLYKLGLNVEISKSKGMKIVGSELKIRNAYTYFMFKYQLKNDYFNNDELLLELKDRLNFDFADYDKTLNILNYYLKRIEKGHFLEEIVKPLTVNEEYNSIINKYVKNKNESYYIGNFILNERLNQLTKLDYDDMNLEARDITDYLISSLLKYQPIADLKNLEYFISGLLQHIRCALYRIRNNIVIKNDLRDQIKYTMPVLYAFTAKKLQKMEKKYNVLFDESELSFIAMYLATIYEENNHRKELNILLLCSYGIASGGILRNRLTSKIPSTNIIGPLNIDDYKAYIEDNKVDLIISTMKINIDDIPVVRVKALIDNNDILKINNKIDELYFNKMCKQLIFQIENEQDEHHSLKEYLNKNTVSIYEGRLYWRKAIALAAKPLYKKGLISKHYIDEMISAVDKYGTYMILTENTAFVHAGKEDGIKENCLSMMAFKQKIDFGDIDSKKVNNIVVLGIKDQNKTDLLNVVSILSKKVNIEMLKNGNYNLDSLLNMHN